MKKNRLLGYGIAYYMFQTGGIWDHKPALQSILHLGKGPIIGPTVNPWGFLNFGPQYLVFYDIFSNLHYGFLMAAAGYDLDRALWAARQGGAAGKDDGGDDISTTLGYMLYAEVSKNGKDPRDFNIYYLLGIIAAGMDAYTGDNAWQVKKK